MTDADPRRVVETVWRIESARIIATLTRIVKDVGIAEELAQDTMVIALEQWPVNGVPDDPGPWLMATAKHRAIDLVRRRVVYARKLAEIGRTLDEAQDPDYDLDDGNVEDDILRLMFIACHPGAAAGRPHRPHAAPARRPDHGRDRPRGSGAVTNRRPADQPSQEDSGGQAGAVRDPGRRISSPSGSPASLR